MFEFKSMDLLTDGEIDLKINEKIPANNEKGYVPAYDYSIMIHNTNIVVGSIRIRIGYNEGLYYAGNIGYDVRKEYRGHNFALKACRVAKQVAIAHNMDRLYITCDPDNIPSRRTCEKLGLKLLEIVNLPNYTEMYQEGERQKCIFEWKLN